MKLLLIAFLLALPGQEFPLEDPPEYVEPIDEYEPDPMELQFEQLERALQQFDDPEPENATE